MKKIVSVFIIFLLISGLIPGCAPNRSDKLPYTGNIKYTMYIGLNDKDTYTQLIPYDEAEKKVSEIVLKYVDGYTQMQAKGAYKDDEGIVTLENSLIYEIYAATDQQMEAIMNEVLTALNQHSILLEKQTVKSIFFEGDTP